MADLAHLLLRTIARAFYTTEHALVIDALVTHSTLQDNDLALAIGMQIKHMRKVCGRLKEDGLLSVQTRAEKKTDGSGTYYGGRAGQPGKERVTHKEWYYLNFHRAIDSVKYRMYRISKRVESLSAPTTEKKDLACPRCKSQYTELEVMDKIDPGTGYFLCHRCSHVLDPVDEDERANENQSMKRLNSQLEKILRLMQQIDGTDVPENDFQSALAKHRPVIRTDANPGPQRVEIVDLPGKNMQSTRGLELKPEKIAVQVQDDETVKRESEAEEARLRKEKEARQNALPDWIAKSTVSGDITAIGAKEDQLRREREAHLHPPTEKDGEEQKATKEGEDDVMAAYWEELAKAQAEEARKIKEEEEEDDDEDEDEFEDVDVRSVTPFVGSRATETSVATTPIVESSNSTDNERETKRIRIEPPEVKVTSPLKVAASTPAASEESDDELEFENV